MNPMQRRAQVERLVPPGFYETYISVIYGVLAGVGLQQLSAQFLSRAISGPKVLLFVGVFVSAIHFWMVCLSSDPLSDAAYLVLERSPTPRMFNIFLVVDVLYATAFAGALLLMFNSITDSFEPKLFFYGFSALAILSFLYDVSALCVAAFAFMKAGQRSARAAVERYVRTYGSWLWQDALYVAVALTFYFVCLKYFVRFPIWFAGAFLLTTIVGLVLDAIIIHPSLYREIQLRASQEDAP